MTLDPERALTAALIARLRADPTLVDPLGSPPRIFDEPPLKPVHPYVHIGRMQLQPFGGSDGEGADAEGVQIEFTLTSVSRFGGAEEAKRVNAQVRAALHDAALPIEGHRLVNLRVVYADVFKAADWRSTYGVTRLRAVLEPVA